MKNVLKDRMFPDCPIRNVLARICDKWSLLVIYVMKQQRGDAVRFNELRKMIPDISQKMLTSTLRTLEADGYVTRKVYAEVPPRVEYSITPMAESLLPIVDDLLGWAADHMPDIVRKRERYVMGDA